MHMSDALLSPAVGLGFHAASAGLLAITARRAVREDGYERRLPTMGVLGAFVFAAQMVTFAIPGTGSSGHLAGGALLAILLGPSAAFLVMASVLTVQALFFADGGLLALGCNLFNLGFWPAFAGIAAYRAIARRWSGPRGALSGALVASVLSVELGAIGVSVETALSGRSDLPFLQLLVVMAAIHLPIAVIEGIVTGAAVRTLSRWAPDRIDAASRPGASRIPVLAGIAGVTLFAATFLASFASERPDGLSWAIQRVARVAPAEHAEGVGAWLHALQSRIAVLPGYALPGADRRPGLDAGITTAGVVGSLLVGAVVLLAGGGIAVTRRALRPHRARTPRA
jgi:cobalt/nickel transport system permease protein